jgi:hypothetical protein
MRSLATDRRYMIDVSKPWHVAWWAAKLGVSMETLLDAVSLVGNASNAVEQYLAIHSYANSIIARLTRPTPPTLHSVNGRADG